MKVSEFRLLIESAERKINQDIHSCAGKEEIINWFGVCFDVFQRLNEAECKRATEDDINRKERANDGFSAICTKHENLWQKARRRFLDHHNAGMTSEDITAKTLQLKELLNKLAQLAHNIKVYRSALHHFESKASEFQVRRWKRLIAHYERERENVLLLAQGATEEAKRILSAIGK